MAIVGGQDDEELNPNGKPETSGEGGFVSGGSGGQGATTKAAPTSSGGYTNLTSYLQANQDSGATTGRAAEGVVDQSGRTAQSAQAAYGQAAGGDIADSTAKVGVNQKNIDTITSGGAKADPTKLAAVEAGRGNIALNEGKYTGPTSLTADAYSGPAQGAYNVAYNGAQSTMGQDGKNTISGLSGRSTAAQTAAIGAGQDVAANAKNAQGGQAGVSALLQKAYQQPSYTHGENNLDAFLAGGTTGGRAALGQAKGVAKTAEGGYGQINDMLAGQIDSGKATAANTNAAYKDATTAAMGQTGKVQQDYNNAIYGTMNDHTASDAWTAAAAKAQQDAADKLAADNKAAVDKQTALAADAAAKTEEQERLASVNTNNNPMVSDPAAEDPTKTELAKLKAAIAAATPSQAPYQKIAEMFPAPAKSQANPLIPNPIPNPVPVIPTVPVDPEEAALAKLLGRPTPTAQKNPAPIKAEGTLPVFPLPKSAADLDPRTQTTNVLKKLKLRR